MVNKSYIFKRTFVIRKFINLKALFIFILFKHIFLFRNQNLNSLSIIYYILIPHKSFGIFIWRNNKLLNFLLILQRAFVANNIILLVIFIRTHLGLNIFFNLVGLNVNILNILKALFVFLLYLDFI